CEARTANRSKTAIDSRMITCFRFGCFVERLGAESVTSSQARGCRRPVAPPLVIIDARDESADAGSGLAVMRQFLEHGIVGRFGPVGAIERQGRSSGSVRVRPDPRVFVGESPRL